MHRYTILMLISMSAALAAGPLEIDYQAYLQNTDGTPVVGSVSLQIGVWNDPTSTVGSDLLYAEDHAGVVVDNGLVSVALGSGNVVLGTFDAALFSEDNRWLEISVDGETLGPRRKFLSVPYALQARQADTLAGLSGAVMHFALAQCPPGWTEFVDARGRAIVGLPVNGTVSGVSGSPMADLETRQHTHSVSIPPDTTTSSPSHSHSVPSLSMTSDTHNHRWSVFSGGASLDWFSYTSSGQSFRITNWSDGMDSAGSGVYPIAAPSPVSNTFYTDQDTHNHFTSASNTGNAGNHNHQTSASTVPSSTSTSNPTLPYVQLLTCIKD